MTPRRFVAILLAAALPTAGLAAEPEALVTNITAVTVFADRAQVTRTVALEVPRQPGRFVIGGLPGWIDPDSVRVALEPPGAGRILDVSVATTHLAEATEESVRKAAAELDAVTEDIAGLQDEERTLNEEIARLDALRTLALDRLPREMALGAVNVKSLGDSMAYVTEAVRTNRKQLRVLARKRRDLEPVRQQRQLQLNELQVRAQLRQTAVTIELAGTSRAQLRVTYLTPGAAWEPSGELRATSSGKAISVQQYASVVQTTGEDWLGATLAFSTQRPDDVLDVPRAHGLMLDRGGAGLGEVIGKMAKSFSSAQTLYTEQNSAVARKRQHWGDSLARQAEVQTRAVESFARMTSRGTTAHFAALAERPVRSDGKVVRVPISSGDFAARAKVVAVPEVSLNAVRVADLANGGKTPILPGRVALFTDGAFVGSGELDFAAPGEAFSVYLGVVDRIKLERTLDKKLSVLRRSGKRTEMELAFVLSAENLGDEPVTVDMAERIPVAQAEEIDVEDVELPPKVKADGQGVARWTETIAPHAKVTWRVSYTLEYPSDFVNRARSMRDHERPSQPGAPSPRKMYDQIDMLEKML